MATREECDHPVVDWEPYQINNRYYTDRVTTVHWFICEMCRVRACVTHSVYIDQP